MSYRPQPSRSNTRGEVKKERPSRTLFVRNISYEVTEEELRPTFEQFGEIKKFFNLVSKRGMAFITYYDLRDADKAKRSLQDFEISGRTIDIHYSLPKDEAGDGDDPNSGTLYVILNGNLSDLHVQDLKTHFEQWGEIREIRDCKGSTNTKFVEYWSLKDSERACNNSNGTVVKGVKLEVRFAFHTKRDEHRSSGREDRSYQHHREDPYTRHPPQHHYNQPSPSVPTNLNPYPMMQGLPQGTNIPNVLATLGMYQNMMPNGQIPPSSQIPSSQMHNPSGQLPNPSSQLPTSQLSTGQLPHTSQIPPSHHHPSQHQTQSLPNIPTPSSSSQSIAIDQMAQLATLLNANKQSSGVSTAQQIATMLAQQQQQQQLSSQTQSSDPRNYQSPYVSQNNKYKY